MRTAAKTPLVLAAIAVALGAYILLVERHHSSTDQARALRPHLLPGFNRQAATEIAIERTGQPQLLLSRAGSARTTAEKTGAGATTGATTTGAWRVAPEGAPADASAVAALLDLLDGDGLEIDRETGAPPGATGLDAPAVRLTIATPERRWVIALGHADASGRGVFVSVAGDPRTLVVGRRLRDLVAGGRAAFRERRILAPEVTASLTALAFESPGQSRRTLRKRSGLWLNNNGFFAARAGTTDALAILAGLQAAAFPSAAVRPATPPDRALDLTTDPTGADRVRLVAWDLPSDRCGGDADETQHLQRQPVALAELVIGSRESDESHTPPLICLDAAVVQRLWRALDAADHRESHLLMVDPGYADGMILIDGDRRVHLRRDSTAGWKITEPTVSYAADAHLIDEWLARLAATAVVDRGSPGKGPRDSRPTPGQERRLSIEGALPTQITVTRLPRGEMVRVDRAGEGGPVTAPAALFTALDPDPLRFRSRAVLSLPRFDVTGIAITGAQGRIGVRRGPGETWESTGATGAPANAAAINRLLDAISDLQAERFVTPSPPRFEVDRTIDFEMREGATPHRQRIELARACLARLADIPVFEVSATTCADLRSDVTRRP